MSGQTNRRRRTRKDLLDAAARLLHVVEYAADGRMKRENVWIDLASILQQLPQ